MCKNCYHRLGRVKTPKKCDHKDRPLYALGLCKPCYQINYSKNKRTSDKFETNDENYNDKTYSKNQKNSVNQSIKNSKDSHASLNKSDANETKENDYSLKNSENLKKDITGFKNVEENRNNLSLINDAKKLNQIYNLKPVEFNVNKNPIHNIARNNPFKIQKNEITFNNSSVNNINDLNKRENFINEIPPGIENNLISEKMNSTSNVNKDMNYFVGNKFLYNNDKNENLNSNNLLINMGNNNNNNNFLNNINLQTYFNNIISNNIPYYACKGTFQNNAEDYSFIEDFCGNFFQNNNPTYFVDSKTDSQYSDLGEF
jgi:hypothetical protein